MHRASAGMLPNLCSPLQTPWIGGKMPIARCFGDGIALYIPHMQPEMLLSHHGHLELSLIPDFIELQNSLG